MQRTTSMEPTHLERACCCRWENGVDPGETLAPSGVVSKRGISVIDTDLEKLMGNTHAERGDAREGMS